ncbi:MAG TPA: alpha/beta fold hydrolase [Steroidobacteraceae bacterium]
MESPPDHPVAEFRPPAPQPLTIPGPLGPLEARLENPLADGVAPTAIGVVCHPHPLHGGTMQNKVVHTVARAMQEAGAPTVRFNFRGVGQSAGTYAQGVGEIDDALAVIAWARDHWQCESVWLAGFSFGAAVALHAALVAQPAKLVTVAPPVGRLITQPIARPSCPWLIVQGDRDELVDFETVQRWAASYAPQAPHTLVVKDAEHFFHGRLGELRRGVLEFLASGA